MSEQGKREDPQYKTNSIADLHELLQRAENYHGEGGNYTIAAEFADAADFVAEELVGDEAEVMTA